MSELKFSQERLLKVILGPVVSEKATELADARSQFVFRVSTDATKAEINSAKVKAKEEAKRKKINSF